MTDWTDCPLEVPPKIIIKIKLENLNLRLGGLPGGTVNLGHQIDVNSTGQTLIITNFFKWYHECPQDGTSYEKATHLLTCLSPKIW